MTNTKTTPRRFNGTIECWGAIDDDRLVVPAING